MLLVLKLFACRNTRFFNIPLTIMQRMTSNDVLHDVQVFIEHAWNLFYKSLGAIIAGAFASILKVKLSNRKMSFMNALTLFFLSFACGSLAAILTNNTYIAIISALVGDRVIQWIMIKFNEKNIDQTMKKINDKIKPL